MRALTTMSSAIDPKLPESRSEAQQYISYQRLVATGKDVQKRGPIIILTFAGHRDPKARAIALRHRTGKAAKHSQMLMRRELRRAKSDREYNDIVQAIINEIEQSNKERADNAGTESNPAAAE
jgi:hypothetical protein